ncbi:MAG: hypothetical protein KKB51_09545 [Candidatus Riflebacteria bacterium]|nr:hypothetical protein [Candidatus Riflebacteria bacterium]
MEPFKIQLLVERAKEIKDKAEALNRNDEFARLEHNLELACEYSNREEQRRPLIITLAGGTGVGKSYIFSSLCGVDGLSPSSPSVRGFTRKLYISASEEDRCFLPFSSEEANFVDISLPGLVLIDTPDLDTIHAENARIAKKTVAASDIIVCVTTPDKRSDFIVNQNVIEWAERKRWFFVMNKADTADVTSDQLRRDFIGRLKALGFADCNQATFVFSANDKNCKEFKNFSDNIVSARSLLSNRLLKQEACLRQFIHAFNHGQITEHLLKLLMELKNSRESFKSRLLEIENSIANSESICNASQQAFLAGAYLSMSRRRSFFLFPYLLVNRWLADGKDFSFLEKEVERAYRNSNALKDCFIDERRSIEDKGLAMPHDYNDQDPDLYYYFRDAGADISHQIRVSAEQATNSQLFSFYIVLANLLPLLVLLQVLYRAIIGWLTAVWLPTDFFVHALFMILAATIPGYLLVIKGLTRLSDQAMAKAPRRDAALNQLNTRIEQIEDILQLSSQLHSSAESELKKIQAVLPEKSYGISASN